MSRRNVTRYERICLDQFAAAEKWDLTHRLNRAGLRSARRRLWGARYGMFVWASLGAAVGGSAGWFAVDVLGLFS